MEDAIQNQMPIIKQPKPYAKNTNGNNNISSQTGVLKTPIISNTPIVDHFVQKKQQVKQNKNTFKNYKKENKNKISGQDKLSAAIVILGITSLVSLIKSFKRG